MSDQRADAPAERIAAATDAAERWKAVGDLAKVPGEEAEDVLLELAEGRGLPGAGAGRGSPGKAFQLPRGVRLRRRPRRRRRRRAPCRRSRTPREGRSLPGAPSFSARSSTPRPTCRVSAAAALPGPAPGADTVAAIEAAARREGDPNARAALLLALGRTGRREAIAPLLAALEEGNLWLQVHALEALGSVGDPEIAPRILPLLGNDALRQGALHALARLRSPVAAEPLVRRAAAGELDPFLLAACRAALEVSSESTLASLRPLWPEARRQLLISLLEDPEEDGPARTDAAHLMALLDVPRAALAVVDATARSMTATQRSARSRRSGTRRRFSASSRWPTPSRRSSSSTRCGAVRTRRRSCRSSSTPRRP